MPMNLLTPPENLFQETLVEIPSLPFPKFARGKVREIFDLGENLLLIATDRISAYDHALQPGIPGKGIFLTALSRFWFQRLQNLVPLQVNPHNESQLQSLDLPPSLFWRSLLVTKCQPLPIECVVRGYLAGSAWESYQKQGSVQGYPLPKGLSEGQALPEPLFTPTTKEKEDRPLTIAEARDRLNPQTLQSVQEKSLLLYREGARIAREAGLLLADTKFEFGRRPSGEITLIDEVLTPDSSRFWPAGDHRIGQPQPGFDKQFVRDYLRNSGWQKGQTPPPLPPEVVQETHRRYRQAWEKFQRLSSS